MARLLIGWFLLVRDSGLHVISLSGSGAPALLHLAVEPHLPCLSPTGDLPASPVFSL